MRVHSITGISNPKKRAGHFAIVRVTRVLVIAACALVPCTGMAQVFSQAGVPESLLQRLAKGQLILRNFSAAAVVQVSVQGDATALPSARIRSFSVIQIKDAHRSGDHLVLTGTKEFVRRKSPTLLVPQTYPEPVEIDIQISSDASQEAMDKLSEALFFPDTGAALSSLPKELADLILPMRTKHTKGSCDCSQRGTPACPTGAKQLGIVLPEATHSGNLEIPAGTPSGRWNVQVVLELRADGKVGNLWLTWLTQLNGGELALAAVEAAEQDQFVPPSCHNIPFAIYLSLDSTFIVP